MKVCPKCARSFAERFQFCPQDAAELVKYDLRAYLKSQNEFRFLLPQESLLTRLRRELSSAVDEFKRNPQNFLAGLMRGDGSSRRRKRLLQAGVASALIVYALMATGGLLVGLFTNSVRPSEASKFDPPGIEPWPVLVVPVFVAKPEQAKSASKSNQGFLGGSLQQRQQAHGGGSGGDKAPASRGAAPAALLAQQVMKPDLELPKIQNPTWIVTPTIYADPKSFLKTTGPPGSRNGQTEIPSLGNRPGTAVGNGKGPGYDSGEGGNTGDDKFGIGGTKTSGVGSEVYTQTANLRPTILSKERAKYTELARETKIQGTVLLSVIFGADGRIHDIRTVHGLPNGLTESAIEAAQRIRFNPAVRDGKPVNVRTTLEYNFTLY